MACLYLLFNSQLLFFCLYILRIALQIHIFKNKVANWTIFLVAYLRLLYAYTHTYGAIMVQLFLDYIV